MAEAAHWSSLKGLLVHAGARLLEAATAGLESDLRAGAPVHADCLQTHPGDEPRVQRAHAPAMPTVPRTMLSMKRTERSPDPRFSAAPSTPTATDIASAASLGKARERASLGISRTQPWRVQVPECRLRFGRVES